MVGLHQPFHELDLVDADSEEKFREFRPRCYRPNGTRIQSVEEGGVYQARNATVAVEKRVNPD